MVGFALAVCVTGGAAVAASGPANPLVFVLRPSDFPAKSDPVDAGPMPPSFQRKLHGIHAVGRGARYFASIPFGPGRSQTVSGLVVTSSVAEARTIFAWQRRTTMRVRPGTSLLRLPRLGDAQVALTDPKRSTARLLVRTNGVVWRIDVGAEGELALASPRLRAELVKYGTKQQRKIGT